MSLERISGPGRDAEGQYFAAVYKCVCGAKLETWDAMDNECGRCGRNYNSSGQEVKPLWECFDHDDY